MKIGSLFDGSGGFPLAATLCGIEPVWAAEVEPYPIAVTRSRFPNMKHLGSVTEVKGNEIEPVDIISFGAPCQDLSVAGKRAGLRHEGLGDEETTRSGLFMEAVRIIKEMREATNGEYPRYAIYENVPGAFSSSKGNDWRIVLEEIIKIVEPTAVMPDVPKGGWPYADCYVGDGWSLAYRVLDAQYWGVPQRRRRIYLVADFRGGRAGKISFEREGLRGYFAESGTQRKGIAGDAESGTGAADCGLIPYTLKIRTGCAVDATGKAAGKGALIQTNKAATLAVTQDQYLFQPVTLEPGIAAREGGHIYEGVCGTLRANAGDNQMAVAYPMKSGGFCPEQSAKTRGVGWEEEMAPTLRAGVTPAVVYSVENHPADSRVNIDDSGKVQTLTSRMGTGGGNVPMVMEPVVFDGSSVTSPINAQNPRPGDPCHTLNTDSRNYVVERRPVFCLQGNGIDRADTAGCNGKGWKEDTSYTLNTIDRPAVVYKETYQKVTGPLMANSHPGSYTGQDAYNDMFVVGKEDAAYGVDSRNATEYLEKTGALQADAAHNLNSNNVVRVKYIVRRLTPTECARLQGFPDDWAHPDIKTELSDEEYAFWLNVRNTHAAINDKAVKDYTRAQMLTWYNKLHTDSAEYKLWGNGIAFPCALYVMQGIADGVSP